MKEALSFFGLSREVNRGSIAATLAVQAVVSLLLSAFKFKLFKWIAKYFRALDIYALGVIFGELVSRKRPFQDEENATEGHVRAWIKDGG